MLSVINRFFADGTEYILQLRLETLCDKLKKILSSSDVSLKVKEAAVELLYLRLKNAVNDEFLQDLLRKVMNIVFFNGEIKFGDQLVALARANAWFLRNQVLQFTFIMMESPQCEERTRFLAIEFVLVVVEDKKGCQILGLNLHIKRMLSQLLCTMETINENTALDNQEQCILLDQGMKSTARFSRALGGRFLNKILSSSDVSLKVQAAMAAFHFVENCTSNMLQPYLDEIISKLLRCLQDRLLEYYRTVMPYLNFVMTKARGESNGLVLSATISNLNGYWKGQLQRRYSTGMGLILQIFRPKVPALHGGSHSLFASICGAHFA
uniref:Uncharacterized protein n=1 Tax=Salix viminalis TaxID=40686 RepID=A0A6N2MES4_SALVM